MSSLTSYYVSQVESRVISVLTEERDRDGIWDHVVRSVGTLIRDKSVSNTSSTLRSFLPLAFYHRSDALAAVGLTSDGERLAAGKRE